MPLDAKLADMIRIPGSTFRIGSDNDHSPVSHAASGSASTWARTVAARLANRFATARNA